MPEAFYSLLQNRAVMTLKGEDRKSFLQALISNSVTPLEEGRAVWSALLTPQGKFLHEFFLAEDGDTLFLDCEADRLQDLKRRLSLYKLRAKAVLEEAPDFAVVALFGDGAPALLEPASKTGSAREFLGGIAYADPRLPQLGARAALPREALESRLADAGFSPEPEGAYETLRISLGVPDGSRDLEVEKSTLMESGFDELGGIDWSKGCFIGQELTARMRYRGLAKKRLAPVRFLDGPPEPGSAITLDGKEVGELRSQSAEYGLALLRLEALEAALVGGELKAGELRLRPAPPDWLRFSKKQEAE